MTIRPGRLSSCVLIAWAALAFSACRQVEAPAGPVPPAAPTAETFDAIAGPITNMFDFQHPIATRLILNPTTGQIIKK